MLLVLFHEPSGADQRAKILDAALRVIAADGVDAVTHRRVAKAAGVPLGSTTYYLESREQMLREAFHRYLERARALQNGLAHMIPKTTVTGLVELARPRIRQSVEARKRHRGPAQTADRGCRRAR